MAHAGLMEPARVSTTARINAIPSPSRPRAEDKNATTVRQEDSRVRLCRGLMIVRSAQTERSGDARQQRDRVKPCSLEGIIDLFHLYL